MRILLIFLSDSFNKEYNSELALTNNTFESEIVMKVNFWLFLFELWVFYCELTNLSCLWFVKCAFFSRTDVKVIDVGNV